MLRLRLAPEPEEIELEDIDDDEEGTICGVHICLPPQSRLQISTPLAPAPSGGSYPNYTVMQNTAFLHTGGAVGTPKNGKYGDPACDRLWSFFMAGGKGLEVAEELKAPGPGNRGTTGGKRGAQPTTILKQAPGLAEFSSKAGTGASSNMTDACSRIRYRAGNFDAKKAAPAQVDTAHKKFYITFEDGETGQLHLTAESLTESWDLNAPELRLAFDETSNDQILFPILMPSSGRAESARLDLSVTMQGFTYTQLVCVKRTEFEQYRERWPVLSFFVLPESATDLGIGASRYWILQLARKICPDEFRFFFMMDDNVQAWKACPLDADDSVFSALPYPLERFQDGRAGRKKDIPLCEVLAHFQAVEFRDELQKFGMIGFDRLGRREVSIINPFARRHVYKVRDNLSQAHP